MPRRRHVDNAGARLARDVNDYGSALQYLGGRGDRKIANNTYIVQLANPESMGAKLHNTVIVRWYPDAAPMFGATELNSGGYSTTTTKARMNAFLEGTPWSVVQKRYEWFVHNSRTGEKIPFEDGMLLGEPGDSYARREHERRGNPARPSGRGRPPGKRPSSRHSYGVPIKGYSVKRHSRRRPLQYARNPYPRQGHEPDDDYIELAVDSAAGIYAPQVFMEKYGPNLQNVEREDRDILARGPDDEWYWESWSQVMTDAYLVGPTSGERWRIHQDQDIFLIREDAPESVWARFD